MAKEDYRYKATYRVRFAETDLQGVVFWANYLTYMDTAQMDYLRDIGLPYHEMRKENYDLVAVEAHVEYKAPARFDDLLEVYTRVSEVGNSSFRMDFEVCKAEGGELIAKGKTIHCIVAGDTGRSIRVPARMRQLIRDFEKNPAIEPT